MLVLALLAVLLLGGCDLPRDPEGTLERVRGGTLRVGYIDHPPWTISGPGGPSGIEPTLVQAFARSMDARIEWVGGSETEVFTDLEHHELDVVIGGVTEENPWTRRVGVTRPYQILGGTRHVLAVPRGENAFLSALERFLDAHAPRLLAEVAS